MRTTVAIAGGGLAGLHAGRLLRPAGIDFQLLAGPGSGYMLGAETVVDGGRAEL